MFYKKVRKDSYKQMYEFLHNHSQYDILSSWNGLRSIANNVKLYNLPLRNDYSDALAALQEDEYFLINMTIRDFEEEHNVDVFFNGSSGGYLVFKYHGDNTNNFSSQSPINYDSYEDWRDDVREYYGSLKNYRSIVLQEVNDVQAFDKLCDQLVKLVDSITDEYLDCKRRTHDITVTKRFESYAYDSIEDRDSHMKYMESLGYTVYSIIEDTMVEYEMNEAKTVTVTEDK